MATAAVPRHYLDGKRPAHPPQPAATPRRPCRASRAPGSARRPRGTRGRQGGRAAAKAAGARGAGGAARRARGGRRGPRRHGRANSRCVTAGRGRRQGARVAGLPGSHAHLPQAPPSPPLNPASWAGPRPYRLGSLLFPVRTRPLCGQAPPLRAPPRSRRTGPG